MDGNGRVIAMGHSVYAQCMAIVVRCSNSHESQLHFQSCNAQGCSEEPTQGALALFTFRWRCPL